MSTKEKCDIHSVGLKSITSRYARPNRPQKKKQFPESQAIPKTPVISLQKRKFTKIYIKHKAKD